MTQAFFKEDPLPILKGKPYNHALIYKREDSLEAYNLEETFDIINEIMNQHNDHPELPISEKDREIFWTFMSFLDIQITLISLNQKEFVEFALESNI